jgi:hypothetical protein
VTIRPFVSNPIGSFFKLRPEVRWDHSADAPFNGKKNQVTAAIDAVFAF